MSPRIELFRSHRDHLIIGQCFRSLTAKDVQECEKFILENDHLDRDAFAHAVNRWHMNTEPAKRPPQKKLTSMWALVLQSNP